MSAPKSVLFVTYVYPPMGGAGSPRMWQLTRGLAQRGWKVAVLTVKEISHPYPDEVNGEGLPNNLQILRTESKDILRLFRRLRTERTAAGMGKVSAPRGSTGRAYDFFRQLALLVSFPDTRHGWIRPALSEALRLVSDSRPDVIVSSSPPASTHVVGLRLAERSGIPWVADFRDPLPHFLYPSQYPTRIHRRRIEALQSKILAQADAVIANTPNAEGYFRDIDPNLGDRLVTITNGFDPSDFEEPIEPSGEFVLLHAGSLAAEQRPASLLAGVERALAERPELVRELSIVLLGDIRASARGDVQTFVRRTGAEKLVQIMPPVSHAEAIREMRRAFALILILHSGQGCETIVPSKLYEYLATGHPILAVCPPGDARRLVESSPGGLVADFDNPEEIADQILRLHDWFRSDAQKDLTNRSVHEEYAWSRKVDGLDGLLNRIRGIGQAPRR